MHTEFEHLRIRKGSGRLRRGRPKLGFVQQVVRRLRRDAPVIHRDQHRVVASKDRQIRRRRGEPTFGSKHRPLDLCHRPIGCDLTPLSEVLRGKLAILIQQLYAQPDDRGARQQQE